jgi:hypothetical protein
MGYSGRTARVIEGGTTQVEQVPAVQYLLNSPGLVHHDGWSIREPREAKAFTPQDDFSVLLNPYEPVVPDDRGTIRVFQPK